MASFWGEIRRRKVFQVAVAYAIVGWLLAQVAATTFPILLLPDWILRAFVIILLLGFPLAVVLAWAFETTPVGVVRDRGPSAEGETATASGNLMLYAGGALVIGLILGGLAGRWTVPYVAPAPVANTPVQLTANPDENPVISSAISPDGKYLVYTAADGLYLRVVDSGESHRLELPADISLTHSDLDWFPDGVHVLLAAQGAGINTLWKLSIVGGTPRQLATDAIGAIISADGNTIAFIRSFFAGQIFAVGPEGENPRLIVDQDVIAIRELAWSPDSRFILFGGSVLPCLRCTRMQAVDVSSGMVSDVLEDPRMFQSWRGHLPFYWMPDGRLLFGRAGLPPNDNISNIWQAKINPATAQLASEPSQLTQLTNVNVRSISASDNGRRVAFLFESNQADVYVGRLSDGGRQLTEVRRLTLDDRDDYPAGWLPDSSQVLFDSARGANRNIFVQALDSTEAVAIGNSTVPNHGNAGLSPDGKLMLYWENGDRLVRRPVAGGPGELVLQAPNAIDFNCPRDDSGIGCVIAQREDNNKIAFYAFDPEYGLGRQLVSLEDQPPFTQWSLAPDDKTVALVHNNQILRIIDLETGDETEHSLPGWFFGEYVAWTADGTGVFMDGNIGNRRFKKSLIYYSPSDREAVMLRSVPNQWHVRPKSSPDGNYLAFGLMLFSGNVWMIENP